ncbi:MAG: O-methyltransferase [Bacteroidota bacterium]|nr:O-methyltransferase [Bacteroidota bacterium]
MLLEDYIEKYTSPESDVLKELNRETHLKVLRPRMLSGHIQGELLKMISRMIKPENVLEIGTFTGYSAICLSEGLIEGGIVHTIEKNVELEDLIRKYIEKAGAGKKINLYIGDATELIDKINIIFDIVFIDADKQNYPLYYDLAIKKLRKGGLIIADNVLWNGKVLEKFKDNDLETKGVVEFNEKVKNDDNVVQLLLPIRDGLMVIMKK